MTTNHSNLPGTLFHQAPLSNSTRSGQQENPLLMLHRFLRGRYVLAIALAILCGVPGALVGYHAVTPTYTSTAIIRIAPTLPRLLYQYEENQVPPHFDSFVATQASMLSNRRVLDLAATDENLRAAGWPSGPEGANQLRRSLRVSSRRGNELITAQVEHPDRRVAQVAVNAVIAAYEAVQDELTGMSASEREQNLRDLRRRQEQDIDSINAQIQHLARRFHTDNLDNLLSQKVSEAAQLESRILSLEIQLAAARAAQESRAGDVIAEGEEGIEEPIVPEVELEYFAARDRILSRDLQLRRAIETDIEALSPKLGPEHRDMQRLQRRLAALNRQIAERVNFIREHDLFPASLPESFAENGESGGVSVAHMERLLAENRQALERLRADLADINNVRLSIRTLQDRLDRQRESLQATARRLEQIEVENTYVTAGRVSILQRGDLSGSPSRDRRRPLAAMGAMGGAGFGVGLVVLMTFLRGGYRYIDEIERVEGAAALLGTIPDLSAGTPEHASLAALSIHHLRNMLQMNTPTSGDEGGSVYTVSSAMAGDGKTSLALSLAMSYAAMGSRTVLIDADIIGRGLSRQLALSTVPGLCQALKATSLNGEVHTTRVTNLWAIPVGFTDGQGSGQDLQPEQIGQSELKKVLDMARQEFDTVIIDTGPILGSLEANMLAPMSDSVVMVVSRGQSAKVVRTALDRLSRLGAVCGGLVFNKADVSDFDRSISAVSLSGRSLRDQAAVRGGAGAPIAHALLEAVSNSNNSSSGSAGHQVEKRSDA